MTHNLILKLPTDQLWNKQNEEQRYAMLVENAVSGKTYTDLTEIPELEYTDDDGNRKTVLPKQDQHQLHNTRGISVEISEKTVDAYLRGIGLFEELEDGGFQLSNRGKLLKEKYTVNEDWRPYLAGLIVRYFLRTRAILYYLGKGLALQSTGNQQFSGDQLLVAEGVEYGIYHTDVRGFSNTPYNGAFTFYGLKSKIQRKVQDTDAESAVDTSDLEWLEDLYSLEFQIVASNFKDGLYVTGELEQLKKRLMDQITSEPIDMNHLEDIKQESENILEEFDELEGDPRSITYVPNLLLQANLGDILGPDLWAEIEAKSDINRSDFNQLTLQGARQSEPVGGNIISTTRYSLRLLLKQNLLMETEVDEDTVLIPNRPELETLLAEDQFTSLIEEIYKPNKQSFLETLKTAYSEHQSDTGWVLWKDIVDSLCAKRGMTETEVNDQFLKLERSGIIEVSETQMGLRSSPEGPPGYEENPKVTFEFRT